RRRTADRAFQDDDRIFALASALLGSVDTRRPVRLLGVGVSDFVETQQISLFEDDTRSEAVSRVMDAINQRAGRRLIKRGRELYRPAPPPSSPCNKLSPGRAGAQALEQRSSAGGSCRTPRALDAPPRVLAALGIRVPLPVQFLSDLGV